MSRRAFRSLVTETDETLVEIMAIVVYSNVFQRALNATILSHKPPLSIKCNLNQIQQRRIRKVVIRSRTIVGYS